MKKAAETINYMLAAALAYAECGWPVFPLHTPRPGGGCSCGKPDCEKPGKHPRTEHGLRDASTDPEIIHRWWTRWPNANIGIPTGKTSGLLVLDVDGDEGRGSLEALCKENGPVPDTRESATGRGKQFFFIYPAVEVRNSTGKLGKGLDVRGEGGYIVVPPSMHFTGKQYRWLRECPPVSLPGWLLRQLQSLSSGKSASTESSKRIPKGQRNAVLTSLAGSMRKRGMTEEAITAALLAENRVQCDPPLTDEEVMRIASSIGKYPAVATNPVSDGSLGSRQDEVYFVERGRICFLKRTGDGSVTVPLCNFTARVAEEISLDDGRETHRMFRVEGELCSGEKLDPIRISSTEFSSMRWATANWGIRARVSAGFGAQDRLREAVQAFSTDAKQRRVFTHTGWAQVDGQPVFLSFNGAIGRTDVEVELPAELRRYLLPQKPENVREAMGLSLRLLEVAPLTITAPLLAGVFRAPLASAFPVDVLLFAQGKTGTHKSTLAALFLCHFGDFERLSLPDSFLSTANRLEHSAFLLKDLPFVVDDYAPSPFDAREMEAKLMRLVRAQGNRSGRGRLRSDLTETPTHPPRGLIIVTGEQCPSGQSILARTLIQRFEPGDVKLDRLSELQTLTHRLPHAMAGYVAWLTPQIEKMPDLLREAFIGARQRASKDASHLRVPEAIAHLWLGLNCALQFAEEIGSISHNRSEEISGQCWEALLAVGREQSLLIEGESPIRRFLEVLATILAQGRGVILTRESEAKPAERTDILGWGDSEFLYLLPDAVYRAVAEFCRGAGCPFPVKKETLLRDLKRSGISDCEEHRTLKMVRVGESTRRLLVLKRDKAEELAGQPFRACAGDVSTVSTFASMGED